MWRKIGYRLGFRGRTIEEELDRVESLGLDCEVGFALRQMGNERPSLFRWVYTPPPAILDLIENGFGDFFELGSLVANTPPDVIKESRYAMYFHSNLRVEMADGAPVYLEQDPARRERILRAEQNLVRSMATRFEARYATPHTLYVMVRHEDMPDPPIETIATAIRVRSGQTPFDVLEVRETAEKARHGAVERIAPHVYRGWVSFLHGEQDVFDLATTVDHANWQRILKSTLERTAPNPSPWWRRSRTPDRSHAV